MSLLIYLFSGFALFWYACSPSYRRKTNARWKAMRPHKLVFEIGSGILGLFIIFVFLWFVFSSVFE
jgi:hypothetical protein